MRGVSTFLFNIQCINTTFILKLFYSSNESFVIFASYSIPTIADPETEENSRNLSLSLSHFARCWRTFQATNRRGDFVMRAHARAFAAKSAGVVIRREKGRSGRRA